MSTKDKVIKAIQELPPDASIEDAMEKLYLLYKIDRGIKQADAGKKVSQKEAKKRMEKWLK
jgi:predicted transcriptional regulator